MDEHKRTRKYQRRIGHPRQLLTVRLEPGLVTRLAWLATDQGITLSALLARKLEATVAEEYNHAKA